MAATAQIIGAVAVLVLACTALLLVWRRAFQSVHVAVGPIRAELEAIKQQTQAINNQTTAINNAVNNTPKGTPPLTERIGELEDMQRWLVLALRIIGAHTGASIPDPPRRS